MLNRGVVSRAACLVVAIGIGCRDPADATVRNPGPPPADGSAQDEPGTLELIVDRRLPPRSSWRISPDGDHVVAALPDGCGLWRARDARFCGILEGERAEVCGDWQPALEFNAASFDHALDPEGRQRATVRRIGDRASVELNEIESDQQRAELALTLDARDEVGLLWSARGLFALVRSQDGRLEVWRSDPPGAAWSSVGEFVEVIAIHVDAIERNLWVQHRLGEGGFITEQIDHLDLGPGVGPLGPWLPWWVDARFADAPSRHGDVTAWRLDHDTHWIEVFDNHDEFRVVDWRSLSPTGDPEWFFNWGELVHGTGASVEWSLLGHADEPVFAWESCQPDGACERRLRQTTDCEHVEWVDWFPVLACRRARAIEWVFALEDEEVPIGRSVSESLSIVPGSEWIVTSVPDGPVRRFSVADPTDASTVSDARSVIAAVMDRQCDLALLSTLTGLAVLDLGAGATRPLPEGLPEPSLAAFSNACDRVALVNELSVTIVDIERGTIDSRGALDGDPRPQAIAWRQDDRVVYLGRERALPEQAWDPLVGRRDREFELSTELLDQLATAQLDPSWRWAVGPGFSAYYLPESHFPEPHEHRFWRLQDGAWLLVRGERGEFVAVASNGQFQGDASLLSHLSLRESGAMFAEVVPLRQLEMARDERLVERFLRGEPLAPLSSVRADRAVSE